MTTSEPTLLRWETLTKRRFDQLDRESCVVLVTCSPLEVHGPHLPFGADALEGEGLVRRMLRFLPERHRSKTFLQLPFIYAATDTVPHPGSLFFHPSTTQAVLRDLGRTLGSRNEDDVPPGTGQGPGFDPTIFLYDTVAGGIGLASRLFEEREELLRRARQLIESCECKEGCPDCIGPDASNDDQPEAARKRLVLGVLDAVGVSATH